jgi:hypothetical protein
MREIRTSGSMSGDGKRGDPRVATAPNLDSTENKGSGLENRERILNLLHSGRTLDAGGRIDGEIPHLKGGIEVFRSN